jgi:hypothetical protein
MNESLSALARTVMELHKEGFNDISVEMLIDRHVKEGYGEYPSEEMIKLLPKVIRELFDKLLLQVHLVNLKFFEDGGSSNITWNILPKKWTAEKLRNPKSTHTARARLYFPQTSRTKTAGVRFAPENDFMFAAYSEMVSQSTDGKNLYKVKRAIISRVKKREPYHITRSRIEGSLDTIIDGVNGLEGYPKSLQNACLDLVVTLKRLLNRPWGDNGWKK